MNDNTGRKYHWWVSTPTMKTRDLIDVKGTPDCPGVRTY